MIPTKIRNPAYLPSTLALLWANIQMTPLTRISSSRKEQIYWKPVLWNHDIRVPGTQRIYQNEKSNMHRHILARETHFTDWEHSALKCSEKKQGRYSVAGVFRRYPLNILPRRGISDRIEPCFIYTITIANSSVHCHGIVFRLCQTRYRRPASQHSSQSYNPQIRKWLIIGNNCIQRNNPEIAYCSSRRIGRLWDSKP